MYYLKLFYKNAVKVSTSFQEFKRFESRSKRVKTKDFEYKSLCFTLTIVTIITTYFFLKQREVFKK